MSKLKFKYSLKPKWLEELKIVIRKEGIPVIGTTAIRQLNHRSLDDYIVEDVIGDYDLFSEVPMLSSDGFLKNSVISDKDNEQNSERFLEFTDPNDFKKREVEDKKLFMQRLRIEFTTYYITQENIKVKKDVEELFASYRKHIIKLFYKYSATKEFDK